MQMGVQILTGFLLTLPFQQRFADLDTFQTGVYLTLVALAVLSTGLFVTPVSLHRALFRKHRKTALVTMSDRIARVGVLVLAFVVMSIGAGLSGFLPVTTATVRWFERKRARALALVSTGVAIGPP